MLQGNHLQLGRPAITHIHGLGKTRREIFFYGLVSSVQRGRYKRKGIGLPGMKPSFFIQFGYLGETKDDIRKTIEMINKLLPYEIGISVSYPLPGTGFYEKVKADLNEKTNWTDSDEMALMFRNTYQPAFYKQLYRYVHRSYRMHLALDNIRQLVSCPAKTSLKKMKKAASYFYYLPASYFARLKLNTLEKPAAS